MAFMPLIALLPDSGLLASLWNALWGGYFHTFFPNVLPKSVYSHIVIDIAIFCYLFAAWKRPELRPRDSFLLYALVGWLGIMVASAFFGDSLNRSLWGTFQRATGLMDMVHWTAYAVMIGGLLNASSRSATKKDSIVSARRFHRSGVRGHNGFNIDNFLYLNIGVACFIALVALIQWILSPGRVGSTLDNPIYLGGYSMVMAMIAWKLAWSRRHDKRSLANYWNYCASRGAYLWATVALLGVAVFLSGSRSSVLALVVALITLGAWYASNNASFNLFRIRTWIRKLRSRRWLVLVLGCLLFLGIGIGFYRGASPFQSGGWADRQYAIETGLRAWQERPVTGYGPENYNVAFAQFADPAKLTRRDMSFDSAHNHYVDALVETGALGLAATLVVTGAVAWRLRRDGFMLAAWVGLTVQLFFLFDTPALNLVWAILAGYAVREKVNVKATTQQVKATNASQVR
jgi:O-antigen ligase